MEEWAAASAFFFLETDVMYRDIPEDLKRLIEPVVDDAGLELVDVSVLRGGRPWRLRIIVDTHVSDGRVPVDRCAEVSREIATQLDAADAISVAYHLEVSSPGLDRILAREKDFAHACGSAVKLETRQPLDGRKRFKGRLMAFDAGVARLDLDGNEVGIPFAEVAKAQVVYEFTNADFAPVADSR